MPTTTRTTIPIYLVKTITVILCVLVLVFLYLLDQNVRSFYSKVRAGKNDNISQTFTLIALTVGALLGWSLGSVLQQLLTFRTVEILVNLTLTVLAIICTVCVAIYLVESKDSMSSDRYKYMLGTAVCLGIQSLVCLCMLSWAYHGQIIIVQRV